MQKAGILHDVHADYLAVYSGWRAKLAKRLDHYQERYENSPPKFLKRWEKAWRSRDAGQLIGLGVVLRDNGRLTDGAQQQLACAYSAEELFDEAAQLLLDPI